MSPGGEQTRVDALDVAETATTGYVKVQGQATFKAAADLRTFLRAQMTAHHAAVFIDMDTCAAVDSTFVGTLTSLTMEYRRTGLGHIKLFNVRRHVLDIFSTLGLLPILEIVNGDGMAAPMLAPLTPGGHSKIEIAQVMLDAHEVLSRVNETNALEFKNVVDYLHAKLG
jgi:anti-anti-sigma regulatory factor